MATARFMLRCSCALVHSYNRKSKPPPPLLSAHPLLSLIGCSPSSTRTAAIKAELPSRTLPTASTARPTTKGRRDARRSPSSSLRVRSASIRGARKTSPLIRTPTTTATASPMRSRRSSSDGIDRSIGSRKTTATRKTGAPPDPIEELGYAHLKTMKRDGGGSTGPIEGCGNADNDHRLERPSSIEECAPNASVQVSRAKSALCIDLDPARTGGPSLDVAKAHATGLYGHVARDTVNGHPALQDRILAVVRVQQSGHPCPRYRLVRRSRW